MAIFEDIDMIKFFRAFLIALALLPFSAGAADMIDINTATAAELEQVNGLGPSKANAIVKYRSEHGAFTSLDDLTKVPGIGEKSLEKMRSQLTVTAPKAAEPAAKK